MKLAIRRAFGAWLATWIMVPAMIVLAFAFGLHYLNEGVRFIVVRYDESTKRTLAVLDFWIKYGREPIDNGGNDA